MEFKKAMEKDDLWDAAKNRLVAVVSDGGNMGCRVDKIRWLFPQKIYF